MEQQESRKRPFSWPAILSLIFGLGFLTSAGLIAIPLGVIGLFQTKGNKLRGRRAATWGLCLGLFSLCINITGCPGVFFPPPFMPEDRAFAQFLNDLGNAKYQQCRGNIRPANSENLNDAEFARWGNAFNEKVGTGRLIWCAGKTMFADSAKVYFVYFEKMGIVTVNMFWADQGDWQIVFVPLGFPQPNDLRFSDKYHDDPEFR